MSGGGAAPAASGRQAPGAVQAGGGRGGGRAPWLCPPCPKEVCGSQSHAPLPLLGPFPTATAARPGRHGGQVPQRRLWAVPARLLQRPALPAGGAQRRAAPVHSQAFLPQVRGLLLPPQVRPRAQRGGGAAAAADAAAPARAALVPPGWPLPVAAPLPLLWPRQRLPHAEEGAGASSLPRSPPALPARPALCSRHQGNQDGAYFGTTFPHLFLLTYPELRPQRPAEGYVPKVRQDPQPRWGDPRLQQAGQAWCFLSGVSSACSSTVVTSMP